jgi:hypothetical protein
MEEGFRPLIVRWGGLKRGEVGNVGEFHGRLVVLDLRGASPRHALLSGNSVEEE